jgi:hypothetical protein
MIINQQGGGGGGVSFLDEIKNQPLIRSTGNIVTVTTSQQNFTIFDKAIDPLSPINHIVLSGTFDLTAQLSSMRTIKIKNNGTRLYALQDSSSHVIHQYSLAIPYDINSRIYMTSFNYQPSAGTGAKDFDISDDGTKMIILGNNTSNVIYEYSLSTAFSISSASYTSRSFSLNSDDTAMMSICVSPDGLKLLACGDANDRIYAYALGSAWNLTSVTFTSQLGLIGSIPLPYTSVRAMAKNDALDRIVIAYTPTGGGGDYLLEIKLSAVGVITGSSVGIQERVSGGSTVGICSTSEGFYVCDAGTPTFVRQFWRSLKSRIFLDSVSFGLTNFVGGLLSVYFYGFKTTIKSRVFDMTGGVDMIIARFPSSGEASGMNQINIPQQIVAESNLKLEASLNASSNYSNLRYAINYKLV